MAKGQKRSNREKKKPKATAKKAPAAPPASGTPAYAFNPARGGTKPAR
jgi:hypothetical protein